MYDDNAILARQSHANVVNSKRILKSEVQAASSHLMSNPQTGLRIHRSLKMIPSLCPKPSNRVWSNSFTDGCLLDYETEMERKSHGHLGS